MNSRERVVAAITHQQPDRIPMDGYFSNDAWNKLRSYFGTQNDEQIRESLGLDFRYSVLEPNVVFAERAISSPYQLDLGMGRKNLVIPLENGSLKDEYGICRKADSTGQFFQYTYHPLAEAGLEEVRRYKFPDISAPERYESIRADVDSYKKKYFIILELWNIFKTSWELRGFDRFMMDILLEPRLVESLADKALEYRIEQSRHAMLCGVDMIMIAGDIAMQEQMMISPEVWRKYFKPRLRTWLQEVRRDGDIYFMFHSDGAMESIFNDVIEIGFDVIDPIQPECMDVIGIKRRFGSQVCLHGTISCQKTLPFGTPDDVSAEVRQRIDCCGNYGGLIISPSNTITPDVPLDNILALYGTYVS